VSHPQRVAALATGAIAASTVLFARVLVVVTILDRTLVTTLLPYLAPPFIAGLLALALSARSMRSAKDANAPIRNPLQFRDALEMAVLFQIVLYAVFYVRAWVGDAGTMASGFVLGLTDVDALTMSMTKSVSSDVPITLACRAIAVGIVANSLMKSSIAVALGTTRFKWQAGGSLLAMAAAGAAAIFLI
jgi:uncharacterized membrane protein (DUF4010 family)